MDNNLSKSFENDTEELDEIGKDPKLANIISRLHNVPISNNLILQNQEDDDNPNFKNLISKKYLKKSLVSKDPKDKKISSESFRPLKEEEKDDEKALLDPDEELKIEDHIKQFKVNSVQQYSILRHYFFYWHEICEKRKEMENTKKKQMSNATSAPSNLKNLTLIQENEYIGSKIKNEKLITSPSKIKKDGIEPKSLEKKIHQSDMKDKKKKKKTQNIIKEGDVIHKISKSDILNFIPFCNDIVLPKKK